MNKLKIAELFDISKCVSPKMLMMEAVGILLMILVSV